jgi:Flp pilus assembly pilin Flp
MRYRFKTFERLKRLRGDQNGVVSFEYVLVAVCVLAAVGTVFGSGAATTISTALSGALSTLTP